jgi:hypothetical protein
MYRLIDSARSSASRLQVGDLIIETETRNVTDEDGRPANGLTSADGHFVGAGCSNSRAASSLTMSASRPTVTPAD